MLQKYNPARKATTHPTPMKSKESSSVKSFVTEKRIQWPIINGQ